MKDIAFQKHLSSVMLDNKYDRFVKNRKSGKLDTNAMYKINHSQKLFKRREARKNKHYAVSLVVDCSGSMHYSRAEHAARSADKLSLHLSKIGIPHNIVAFNALAVEIKPFNAFYDKNIYEILMSEHGNARYVYHSYDAELQVQHPTKPKLKLWKFLGTGRQNEHTSTYKKLQKVSKRIEYFTGPAFNSDAEALKIARELLLKQVGTKVMIHLSDGQPAPMDSSFESPIYEGTSQMDYNLKHEVSVTLTSGIELYSIGIQSDDVLSFYPKKRTVVIQDVNELYEAVIKLIKRNLKRG